MPKLKIDYQLIDRVTNISFAQNIRRCSEHYGVYNSYRLGSGFEFAGYRPYAYDSYNKIDWNVYARTEQYFVKTFHEEGNLKVGFIFDNTASFLEHEESFNAGANIALCILGRCIINKDVVTVISGEGLKKVKSIQDYEQFFVNLKPSEQPIRLFPKNSDYLYYISDFLYPLEQIGEDINRLSLLSSNLTLVHTKFAMDFQGDLDIFCVEEQDEISITINEAEYIKELRKHEKGLEDLIEWRKKKFNCRLSYIPFSVGNSIADLFL